MRQKMTLFSLEFRPLQSQKLGGGGQLRNLFKCCHFICSQKETNVEKINRPPSFESVRVFCRQWLLKPYIRVKFQFHQDATLTAQGLLTGVQQKSGTSSNKKGQRKPRPLQDTRSTNSLKNAPLTLTAKMIHLPPLSRIASNNSKAISREQHAMEVSWRDRKANNVQHYTDMNLNQRTFLAPSQQSMDRRDSITFCQKTYFSILIKTSTVEPSVLESIPEKRAFEVLDISPVWMRLKHHNADRFWQLAQDYGQDLQGSRLSETRNAP